MRRTRALLIAALAFPASALAAESDRKTGPDEDIEARAKWFAERRHSATGENPAELRLRALRQLRANQAAGLLGTPGTGDTWVAIGPSPLFWGGSAFSGRITAFAPHPTNSQVLWVGTANGGVWLTTDGGATWTPKSDLQDTLSIGALAIDRTNPQTLWVGTGEANATTCPVYGGAGLLKTTDGGTTWTSYGEATFAGSGISAVILHPTNPQTLWVANTPGQRGTKTCQNSPGPHGVWRSQNGGATWSLRLGPDQSLLDGVSDLQLHPTNPNVLLAGVPRSGVWRSTDGGTTWTRLATGLPAVNTMGRVEVAFDPVVPTTMYTSMENTSGGHRGVWKSTNGGGAWSTLAKPGTGSCQLWNLSDICTYADQPVHQCFFYHDIQVAADRDVWIAGLGVARSSDGGATWSHVCQSNVHVDNHTLAFAADGRVWLGNDGGVFSTNDDGASWTAHNAGLNVTQFYPGPAAHPTDPDFALGGTQDNGALHFTGGPAWTLVDGGDRYRSAISSVDPNNTWYVEQAGLNIWKTTNAGGLWTLSRTGIPEGETAVGDAAYTACPDDGNVFVAVSDAVWRTENAMDLWASNSPNPLQAGYGTAASFLSAGHGCQTYFVGFSSGGLWRTTTGGASWTKIGTFTGFVSDIKSDPADSNTLWVSIQGFGAPHVWRTSTALDVVPSWTPSDAGLPDTPVNAIALDRRRPGVIWLGTDLGIFRSADYGATWASHTDGHPLAIVMGFAEGAQTKEILSFTHGRGAFRLQPDCGGACPGVDDSLVGSKDPTDAVFSWSAVACATLQRYVVYASASFDAPFPSGWTQISADPDLEHREPLGSPDVAFRVVTENGCGDRSD